MEAAGAPSLPTPMSTIRPKLTLDEQSFQDMLAAAFTIQEHNTRRRKEAQPPARECKKCGSPVENEGPLCARCSTPEPRPGEELQRKWASLWLMSQEQGLWPDRTPSDNPDAASSEQPEANATFAPSTTVPTRRFPEALAIPVDEDFAENVAAQVAGEDAEEEVADRVPWYSGRDEALPNSALSALRILPDHSDSVVSDSIVSASIVRESIIDLESPLPDSAEQPDEYPNDAPNTALSLRDLRFKLRFHRADFYLVLAIIVSTFVMIWVLSATPAPGAQRKPRLRLWERALISVGLAEAPEAPARRGNPSISVWVDPKTALYYCAGEELYAKAPGGHLATQREAQLDQFEPAGRVPCE
jgi:hypothetical protein